MDIIDLKRELVETGKLLYSKDLTSGTSGNISVRYENGYLVTASGTALGFLDIDDIVLIDSNGHAIDSDKKPSSESMMHIAIYEKRPDLNAIVHVHAPALCSFAVAHESLDKPILSENVLYFGKIPVAEYGMPSSKELMENTTKYFDKHDTVLMANHGVICGDKTIRHAFYKAETAEAYAKVCIYSKILGKIVELDGHAVKDLEQLALTLKS